LSLFFVLLIHMENFIMNKAFTTLVFTAAITVSSTSFAGVTIDERTTIDQELMVAEMCISGFKYVMLCQTKDNKTCEHTTAKRTRTRQLVQVIGENGGGVKCK